MPLLERAFLCQPRCHWDRSSSRCPTEHSSFGRSTSRRTQQACTRRSRCTEPGTRNKKISSQISSSTQSKQARRTSGTVAKQDIEGSLSDLCMFCVLRHLIRTGEIFQKITIQVTRNREDKDKIRIRNEERYNQSKGHTG